MIVIAEVGINHNGNLNLAHELIRQAKIAGADIAKFQLYDPYKVYGPDGIVPNPKGLAESLRWELKRDDVTRLCYWCGEEGIEFMASVCDLERLEWMEALRVKRYKIASKFVEDHGLCEAVLKTGKETFISLGFWDAEGGRLPYAQDNARYLYCVAKYPTEFSDLALPRSFRESPYFGFSDHTLGIEASLVAVARGAKAIEKHFTLTKAAEGPDHICSITPDELADLSRYARLMEKIR